MDPNPGEKEDHPVPADAAVPPDSPPLEAAPPPPDFSRHVGRGRPPRDYRRLGAGVFVSVAIAGIVLFSVTDLSEAFVPMDERYLDILIPDTEEGTLPFALNELSNVLEDNRISVSGRMTNRSLEPVENVVAVITVRETTGRFPETLEVPVEPTPIAPGDSGYFSVSVTLRQRPDNYSVRFRLENGPFVPHSDERRFSLDLVPIP